MKHKLAICTWRPFVKHDTRYVTPQTMIGQRDRVLYGLCGLLVSTSGPTCKRKQNHTGECSGHDS
jgi:hypothetical protein